MEKRTQREISWIKAARKDFEAFPKAAQDEIRDVLSFAADGNMPEIAKPMKGLGSGVYAIALRHQGDAYRTVYAVLRDDDLWVIHAFKKKSTAGIKTTKHEIDLIRTRIKKLKEVLS